jgi:HAE1 family hydrophobic/amphiphilic exporter-1
MFLSEISITRPIAAIVLSILMLIFGIVSFSKLSVRELPEINEPSVSVVTSYTGAAPNVVETKVTKPIEDELSGISGIKRITSTSRSGRSWINVEFNEKKNMIEAVSDIRDAVSRASKKLPKDVDEPITTRDNGEDEVVLWLNLSSTNMQRSELSDLAKRFVEKQLSLVDGVSQVKLVGAVDKVMYITLDPDKMNSLEITVDDIVDAIGTENIELPSGEIRNEDMYFPVKVKRVYTDEAFFGLLPIKHDGINGTIRLREVADIEFNAKNGESIYHRNGVSSIGIGIIPQSNANPLEVAKAIREEVDILKGQLPTNVVLALDYDSTIYIQNSIDEVYETLVITALLVIFFLYLFIGSWRITIIPAIRNKFS